MFVFFIVFVRRVCAVVGGRRGCVQACTHSRACRDGRSPLYTASLGGDVSCVEALIGSKADVGTDGCNLSVVVSSNGRQGRRLIASKKPHLG